MRNFKKAMGLDGQDIGRTIKYGVRSWRDENGQWQDSLKHVMGPITMITHKKNGDVRVRVGKHDDCPHGSELSYAPDSSILLMPLPDEE